MKRIAVLFILMVFLTVGCAPKSPSNDMVDPEIENGSNNGGEDIPDNGTENDKDNNEESGSENMTKPTFRQISMAEAVEMMAKETGYIILDVRRDDEFAEGHIPGAINYANEDIGTGDIAVLPDKDQLVLVYCRSGRRSKEAAEKLVKLGYTNIVEFGGILDWTGDIEK